MLSQETLTFFIGILGVGGVVFGIFNFFRKPQETSDITDAVMNQRFNELEKTFNNLRDNHLHTIETKIDGHIISQNTRNEEFSNGLVKIMTVLDERLPRK